jgi:hypothetical protein
MISASGAINYKQPKVLPSLDNATRSRPAVVALLLLFACLCDAGNTTESSGNTYASPSWGDPYDPQYYSPARAQLFMLMSAASYCSKNQIEKWNCAACLAADPNVTAKVYNNVVTGAQAFVGHSNNEKTDNIVIAFRGSSNIQNWILDLNFPTITAYPQCKGCLVHKGFYQSWMSVREPIVKEVQRLLALWPKAQIFTTGHSLGASMAALCAAELGASTRSLRDPIQGVYTYGQPRVGNKEFEAFYNTGTHVSFRVVHHNDPVPHLPLQSMDAGFRHTSTEVYYSEENSSAHRVCDGSGEDWKCSDGILPWKLDPNDHVKYLGVKDLSKMC